MAMAVFVITSLMASCATKTVVVPEVRQTTVRQRDTVLVRDSVVVSSTTVVRQADSATMAQFGVVLGRTERAWLVSQSAGRSATSHSTTIISRDSIVHDTIPIPYTSSSTSSRNSSSPWPWLAVIVVAAVAAVATWKR